MQFRRSCRLFFVAAVWSTALAASFIGSTTAAIHSESKGQYVLRTRSATGPSNIAGINNSREVSDRSKQYSPSFFNVNRGGNEEITLHASASIDDSGMGVGELRATVKPPLFFTSQSTMLPWIYKTTAITLATVATYIIHNYTSSPRLNGFAASAIVSLFASLLLSDRLAVGALCGAFAGIASKAVAPKLWQSFVIGILTSLYTHYIDNNKIVIDPVTTTTVPLLAGVGGRLGLVAQLANSVWFMIMCIYTNPVPPAALFKPSVYPIPMLTFLQSTAKAAVYTTIGCVLMQSIRKALLEYTNYAIKVNTDKDIDFWQTRSVNVAAFSLTTLAYSFYTPPGATAALYCGCVVALSSPAVLPDSVTMVLACTLAGLWQTICTGVFLGGWGGKAGTMAILGVLGSQKIMKLVSS